MAIQRITHDRIWALTGVAATRELEKACAAALPAHTLMQRAGLSVARLALALAPHARKIWIACGPGNNGGDGLEAAAQLRQWGADVSVTWLGNINDAPQDARASLARARDSGVPFTDAPAPDMTAQDLCIDALLGLGGNRPLQGPMAACLRSLRASPAPVLAVDMPTGLDADTGAVPAADGLRARNTLSLLTLKPGLFTAQGRDAAGIVWFDDLGATQPEEPDAWLAGPPPSATRNHASHKGSYGDVTVIGGAPGMTGAAMLASRAALHAGAGRVFVSLLDDASMALDPSFPELMLRPLASLDFGSSAVVCGCGGGDAIRAVLPRVLSTALKLVLDADALNAIVADSALQTLLQARGRRASCATVLTPHPLEAARLLGISTTAVQASRLGAAHQLAARYQATIVLKGSGTVIAAPQRIPVINPTGNALLATAGTGDVLAGLTGARLAAGESAFEAACHAAWDHGFAADQWPRGVPLTAGALAGRI